MTTILQFSDTHIVPEGDLVSDRLETSSRLENQVKRIAEIRYEIGTIDAVLVSGDISDDGSAQSYSRFRDILAPLDLPLFVIPGNHDTREPMRAAFVVDGYFPAHGPLNWSRQIGGIHLIGLDTLIEGEGGGLLDAPTLDFLAESLRELGSDPVLLALHHPPFRTGIGFMDKIGLKNRDDLRRVLSGYSGELRIVCGHIHCMMTVSVGRHIALSAPSSCSSFALDTRADAPVGFMDLGDGCLLHKWDKGFQSVHIGPDRGAGPFPF